MHLALHLLRLVCALAQDRTRLALENLALRQQLAVYQRIVERPKLNDCDRMFWTMACEFLENWREHVVILKPDTVVRGHRHGFRYFWRWKSRAKPGRPKLDAEVIALIKRMSKENPLWGAPRIRSELALLGHEVAESTVAKYLAKTPDSQPTHFGSLVAGSCTTTSPLSTIRNPPRSSSPADSTHAGRKFLGSSNSDVDSPLTDEAFTEIQAASAFDCNSSSAGWRAESEGPTTTTRGTGISSSGSPSGLTILPASIVTILPPGPFKTIDPAVINVSHSPFRRVSSSIGFASGAALHADRPISSAVLTSGRSPRLSIESRMFMIRL